MDKLEYTPDLQYAFIPGKENDALQALLAYVREHCSELNTNVLKVAQMVEDVVHLLRNWGVYSHRDSKTSGKYESKYTVHVDHRDLLTDLGAKVIILDGTADVSPMYDEDYIHMPQNRSYSRSLSCLTIKLCDLPTSESDLRDDPLTAARMIQAYLSAATNNDRNLVIFSNEKMEAAFRKLGIDEQHTGHFNNIKGLNSYKEAHNIAQIGVNRKPPVDYLVLDLARSEEIRIQLAEESVSGDMMTAMDNARKALNYSKATMTHHVLADMEQNMYRGVIRNASNTQPFTYYIFFDHQQYADLIKEIRNRYTPLGAKVQIVKRATVEAYKPKNLIDERIEASEKWFECWDENPIRQSKVYEALEIDRTAFNNMLKQKKAEHVKRLVDEAKQNAAEKGLPQGWLSR